MAKLKPTVVVKPYGPGTYSVECAYSKKIVAWMHSPKKGSFSTWDKKKRVWIIGEDCYSSCLETLAGYGYDLEVTPKEKRSLVAPVNSMLFPFQRQAVGLIGRQNYQFLMFEMGLGKTVTTLEALRLSNRQNVLIVCPASVREIWKDEADKWWPDHPPVHLVYSGEDCLLPSSPRIVVTSYELVKHFGQFSEETNWVHMQKDQWDAIVVDESHMIKNCKTIRSRALQELSEQNLDAMHIALSGTPIGQHPKDLWNQLNWLCPGRYGTYYQFVKTFSLISENEYSRFVIGKVANETQLNALLTEVAVRVTQEEVKTQLPKLTIQVQRVDSGKLDAVKEIIEGTSKRVVVFSFRKKTAYSLKKASTRPSFLCTGDQAARDRYDTLAQAKRVKGSTLFATMDSCGLGIDLTAFPIAVFAELSPKLSTMRQALGRIVRLSGKEPVSATFIVQRGSREEQLVMQLKDKLDDINKIVVPGNAETALQQVFEGETLSEEDFAASMLEATAMTEEGDDYV